MSFKGWFDGELRPDAWFDAELHPAGWFDTELIDTVASGGATDHPATLAAVLDSLSASASANLGHPSSVSATLDGLTVSVSATARHPATLSATLDGITPSVSATAGRSATLAGSLDSVTVAVSSTLRHPSSLTAQLDGITPSFSAKAGRSASASATLGDVTASISGATGRKVALGAMLADVGFSANASVTSGFVDHPATITATLGSVSVTASASLGHSLTGAAQLDGVTAAIFGGVGRKASLSAQLGDATFSANATKSGVVDHQTAITAQLDGVSFTAALTVGTPTSTNDVWGGAWGESWGMTWGAFAVPFTALSYRNQIHVRTTLEQFYSKSVVDQVIAYATTNAVSVLVASDQLAVIDLRRDISIISKIKKSARNGAQAIKQSGPKKPPNKPVYVLSGIEQVSTIAAHNDLFVLSKTGSTTTSTHEDTVHIARRRI